MTRTITLIGARGGQGTTTVAAAIALFAAVQEHTVLVSSEPVAAAAVLGVPAPDGPAPVEVSPTLLLAAHDSAQVPVAGVVVVDAGRAAPGVEAPGWDGERYLVLRGPCYVALATALAMGVACDGVILVAESGRSLSADDVTDVLGVPVVASVPASPTVARTVDAGLLSARLDHLADLRPLCHLATRQYLSNRPLMTHTALLLSPATAAKPHIRCRDRPSQVTVWGVWSVTGGSSRVEHRAAQPRRGRLLPGRGRLLGR